MGREIRRVPLDWKHPKHMVQRFVKFEYQMVEEFVPLKQSDWYEETNARWEEQHAKWLDGTHPDKDEYHYMTYEEYAGPRPDPEEYMPTWSEEECKGWCVYDTVSEGMPVTPVFENPEDLIDYLVENGDFWDQERRKEGGRGLINCDPWPREVATRFVMSNGWAPTLAATEDGVRRGQEVT